MGNHNVIWDSPSKDHNGSMPIGNGDVGLNVWCEENGDLLFYISKTDLWSENGRLLKLGRVRVKFTPTPCVANGLFSQVLNLLDGEIIIVMGQGNSATTLRVWVDANLPVIRVEANSPAEFELTITIEPWRTRRRKLSREELPSVYGFINADFPVYVEPDIVVDNNHNNIVWYHRNEYSVWTDNLKLQALNEFAEVNSDPLLNRTFGACIKGAGVESVNSTTLKSATPQTNYILSIYPLCAQTKTVEDWLEQLEEIVTGDSNYDIEEMRCEHRKWWATFWNRSWIELSGFPEAEKISQAYALQRWINACGGRGEFPIKFNGSIFTVDGVENSVALDTDYRRWGGCYWWQNTRLAYWPMLASGDFDLMEPLFKLYRNALNLAKERTKLYYGHEGAFFPETINFWGTYANDNYGWNRDGMNAGDISNNFIRYYWQGGLELSLMMLDFYHHAPDDSFARETLLPLASEILTFYDQHWGRDKNNRILFDPAMALETYNKAVNPIVEIIAISEVVKGILRLPETLTTAQQKKIGSVY